MRSTLIVATLLLTNACAATTEDFSVDSAAQTTTSDEALTSADRTALRQLRTALVGHTSSGSEGDPTQYKAVLLPASLSGSLTNAKVAAAAGPLIPELREVRRRVGGPFAAQSGVAMDDYWRNELSRAGSVPEQARVVNLMDTVNANMSQISNVVVGVRRSGTLENGAVAPMVVGKLPSGRAVALYGIDIWT